MTYPQVYPSLLFRCKKLRSGGTERGDGVEAARAILRAINTRRFLVGKEDRAFVVSFSYHTKSGTREGRFSEEIEALDRV